MIFATRGYAEVWPMPVHSDEGRGLFSPVGQDHQWVHKLSPEKSEKVLLVRLGTKHLCYC